MIFKYVARLARRVMVSQGMSGHGLARRVNNIERVNHYGE